MLDVGIEQQPRPAGLSLLTDSNQSQSHLCYFYPPPFTGTLELTLLGVGFSRRVSH